MQRQPRTQKHPLLRPTLSDKSKNVAKARPDVNSNWYKIGRVKSLFTFPIYLGYGVRTPLCNFYYNCMVGQSSNFTYRNNMFIVYNYKTNNVIYAKDNRMILNLHVKYLRELKIVIACELKSAEIIDIEDIIRNYTTFKCNYIYNRSLSQITCTDCGDKIAKWISKTINDENARIGYIVVNSSDQMPLWDQMLQLNVGQIDESDTVRLQHRYVYSLLSQPPIRSHITNLLHVGLRAKLVRPNIIVATSYLQELIEWKWIMIGNTVLKNSKVLKRSERNIDWQNIQIRELLTLLPIQCEVFFPGQVQVGDDVYVKMID
ncbi:uncharacterized protein LOC105181753 [Harpegnathos saltator]|uniref:uncharacterized protein LOC105181753 n=1 Tax=Harpegnathos saltator TaxID=610380 RepID=UPI00058B00B9|nr:uncharacterized protein LOC105181753 [Harpegnathos saltator]